MIRVLLVDDHIAIRESIGRLISANPDMTVAGKGSDGGEALEIIRKEDFDLVVLDVSMPVKSGIEVLREIKREIPTLPVVMLSIHAVESYKTQALTLGAAGYVTKDRASEELIGTIRSAIDKD